jgi:hypothetical protein
MIGKVKQCFNNNDDDNNNNNEIFLANALVFI